MTRAEFLQGLRTELEGRVPYSVIQENIRYYDSYISDEISKGADEAEVIENLGGPRIIARTIVDAALNTEDRPDGYETYGSGETQEADDNSQSREYSGPYGTVDREESYQDTYHRNVHYVDFSRTDRIFHYLPAYEPVLWDHRTGWLGIVLYLAGTSDLNDLLDV